jgi:hypothetical protein
MNYILCFVLYCVLLSVFVGLYTEYRKIQGTSNLKRVYVCMYIYNSGQLRLPKY